MPFGILGIVNFRNIHKPGIVEKDLPCDKYS
jgi:hypothetical protein